MNCIAAKYAKQIKRFLTLFNESRDFKVAEMKKSPEAVTLARVRTLIW